MFMTAYSWAYSTVLEIPVSVSAVGLLGQGVENSLDCARAVVCLLRGIWGQIAKEEPELRVYWRSFGHGYSLEYKMGLFWWV